MDLPVFEDTDQTTHAAHFPAGVVPPTAGPHPVVIIDPGSVGNLAGDAWAKSVAQAAARSGKSPVCKQRRAPLSVSGVGHGAQSCEWDSHLPVALATRGSGGKEMLSGTLTVPTIHASNLPGLLGLASLKQNRALIDTVSNRVYFMGPGDYNLAKALPPGTECLQGEIAPSGHLVLPCCEFHRSEGTHPVDRGSLTLLNTIPAPPAYVPVLSTSSEPPTTPPPHTV